MKVQAPDYAVRLASTAGVTLNLAAREVREVPSFLVAVAFEKGCTPAGGESAPAPNVDDVPVGPGRESLICEAIERVVERGDPGEFTKADPPRPRKGSVEKEAGFAVTVAEIDAAYALVVTTKPDAE